MCVCTHTHAHTHMHTQLLSHVQLFAVPWTVACLAPLSIGILQSGILEQVAISNSRGSSHPRDRTCIFCVSCIGRQVLYHWATWEVLCLFISVYIGLVELIRIKVLSDRLLLEKFKHLILLLNRASVVLFWYLMTGALMVVQPSIQMVIKRWKGAGPMAPVRPAVVFLLVISLFEDSGQNIYINT